MEFRRRLDGMVPLVFDNLSKPNHNCCHPTQIQLIFGAMYSTRSLAWQVRGQFEIQSE